ncbi:Threonine aldolase [Coemansia sp. RSA 486]|nr:Threonine aldolase [Coemansia sp. RSA 486]KAJ2226540.1 Threonine aldolase [Coemansia sp. RSA 485]
MDHSDTSLKPATLDTSRNWDMRSDTVTTPTSEMLQAMMQAPVGDDVFGEDPTVLALEARIAQLCGKPSALFCASSTMSNQLAIRTHLHNPPESIICHTQSHVFRYESGGASLFTQAQMIPVGIPGANLTRTDVEQEFVPDTHNGHKAPTHLITLENTLAGVVMPLEDMQGIAEFAKDRNVSVHLDGARLWNASMASGVEIKRYAESVDSLNLCLSKGMGCPVGAMLVGEKKFIDKARHFRKMFGGGWRQAGILAAAGLFAIERIWPTMKTTHLQAKRLADGLVALGFELALPVDTNMVLVRDPPMMRVQQDLVDALARRGVVLGMVYEESLRIVLHYQIDDECIDIVLEEAGKIIGSK